MYRKISFHQIFVTLVLVALAPCQSAKAFNYEQFIELSRDMKEGRKKVEANKNYIEFMEVCDKDKDLCKVGTITIHDMLDLHRGLSHHFEDRGELYFKEMYKLCETSYNYNCWSAAYDRLSAKMKNAPEPTKLPNLKEILSDTRELSEIYNLCELRDDDCRRTISFFVDTKIYSVEEIVNVAKLCEGYDYCMDVSMELPSKERKKIIDQCKKKYEDLDDLSDCVEDFLYAD